MSSISAIFRFYAELNDFLSPDKQTLAFAHRFAASSSIKDIIESLGVPHTEVDLILVNGESVNFNYQVKNDDLISVYPVFESYDIKSVSRLRPKPLRITRFMLDVHLGKLAKYLRLLGFDTVYDRDAVDDAAIINQALKEKRIILTRDIGLLKNKKVTHGYWLRATNPKLQVKEILLRFNLINDMKPFTRCLECNGELVRLRKPSSAKKIPARIKATHQQFNECRDCKRIYWEGSHYAKMVKFVDEIGSLSKDSDSFPTGNYHLP